MAGSINTQEYELFPRHDRRKFFYGKAKEIYYDDGTVELRSYSTIVAKIPPSSLNSRSLRLVLRYHRAPH